MAPDVSFSTASFEFVGGDGSTTETDDCSSASSEDLHIGTSSRPQLPLIISAGSVSKSLPSRLPGGIASRRTGPPPRSQSARPHHQVYHNQRASSYSPRPQSQIQPYPPPPPPPPPYPPHHHRLHSPPPYPPPRLRPYPPPPLPPPLNRPVSSPPLPPLDRHGRLLNLAEPQYRYEVRSHGYDCDSSFSSSQAADEPEIEATEDPNYVQHLAENYVELQNQRSTLLAVFSTAKSQRAQVRRLRQSEDEANQRFMAAAQALLPGAAYQLQQLFKAMQDTRLEHQKAEQRLEETVDKLHHGHADLRSQEDAFYRTIAEELGITLFNINDGRDNRPDDSEDWALRGITGDRPEATHPLYEKLRGAFRELQLARELLANTQMKREALHARKIQPLTEDSLDLLETYGEAGKRKAVELRAMALMTTEDIEQLREYDELEKDAKQDIEIYTEKVIALRQECRENGVLPPSSYFQQEGFGVDYVYRDEIRLAPSPFEGNSESTTLAHPVFPLLLSNPTHLLHDFPQTALQSLKTALELPHHAPARTKQIKEAAHEANMHSLLLNVESEDKSEYINRWLLHKLHHSALEAELLWTTFRSRLKILDIDHWQRDVLRFWWRDSPIDLVSVEISSNETDKASKFVGSRAEFNLTSQSDSGQLDGLRTWNLDDSWP
ncbi:hypothetical protein GGR55DRAFT_680736 [Xylaria sp. FL0064]|nr:hypothetical protein GGR55DRAFT_680736 [Xylaria sp. FL0064]